MAIKGLLFKNKIDNTMPNFNERIEVSQRNTDTIKHMLYCKQSLCLEVAEKAVMKNDSNNRILAMRARDFNTEASAVF